MNQSKRDARLKRKVRIRKKISGCAVCPRLVVFRSNRHVYAQLIDDVAGKTLVAASTLSLKDEKSATVESAKKVGVELGKLAKEKSIVNVVFDRNGFLFHGQVQAVAEGARESGLNF